MIPYEHFFWNYALFHRKRWAWKVGVGGLFPDLIYVIAFAPKMFSYESFFDWMQDPFWETVWSSQVAKSVHSLLIWGGFFILFRIFFKKRTFRQHSPFLFGWGFHILFDAFTHVSDGYAPFHPLSDYRFPAPLSYWERQFHAREYFWVSHSLMGILVLIWIVSKLRRYFRKSG